MNIRLVGNHYQMKLNTFILIIVFIQNYAKIPLMAFLQEDALEGAISVL